MVGCTTAKRLKQSASLKQLEQLVMYFDKFDQGMPILEILSHLPDMSGSKFKEFHKKGTGLDDGEVAQGVFQDVQVW